MKSLNERLQAGEILLLDGGVSTEIRRRGVALDKNVWSGLATKTNPDEVRQVRSSDLFQFIVFINQTVIGEYTVFQFKIFSARTTRFCFVPRG